ncbi:hypothetical protein [Mesorhizobium sp. B4-1-4]|uniref:hypothetical protein n=1 Tax=Mesorhizobium sp. B4-1-4 TaxID=2589888 RepID=UPI0015E34E68|nr:hypothetical protein [Mesorhizobium sp. B4-1-4]UCI34334.1 hypothetical protein FJW03_13305 [Mesorhizobium sp. B4-1-4]
MSSMIGIMTWMGIAATSSKFIGCSLAEKKERSMSRFEVLFDAGRVLARPLP